MIRLQFLILAGLFCSFLSRSQSFTYPETRMVDQTDDYFGTKIKDPYRWLEDDKSAETAAWVKTENEITFNYLSKIPFRSQVKDRMTKLWNFPKWSSPFKGGPNYFVYTNDGLQNQFVLNIIRGEWKSEPESILDPNALSPDGTINIAGAEVSPEGKYLAYAISKSGSDWEEIHVRNTSDGTDTKDLIRWVKFSGIAWYGDGFYYSRYNAPDSSNLLKGKNEFHKVYFHQIGRPPMEDVLVYLDQDHPMRNFRAAVTDDQEYLILSGSEGTGGNNLQVKRLKDPHAEFKTLVSGFSYDFDVIDHDVTGLLVRTDQDAPKYRLIRMDPDDPSKTWTNILPETEDVLQEAQVANDLIIAKYMKDAKSILKVFDKKGQLIQEIPLASIGTVDQLSVSRQSELIFYALNTFTAPTTIYYFNLKTKEQGVYFQPKTDFKSDEYETKQIFYSSKDGTRVPMFLVHRKGLILDGNNPTLLFGYGGFNLSQPPVFKIERLTFLEQGGVLAFPNLRGGGEYGEKWHEAGTKLKKQNVFDDFIAAAEYLIQKKYTQPAKLAIGGRSNGGLLVGAVMTQRPELFKVAIPTVGVMDMLRYHTFTIGWAWKGDYGSSEDSVNFKNLLSYSPLHNIRPGISYPATMATTGDHDDRVVPAHSFKFISALQAANKGPNPVLIRIDVNAGHAGTTALGSSKPVSKQIEEQSDIFSFLMFNLGMQLK